MKPKTLVLDLDGVMTDGKFFYNTEGKVLKSFGPDDNEALRLLSKHIQIVVVTADKRGYEISSKRVAEDMELELHLVDSKSRLTWISENYSIEETIYMGDGIYDPIVFEAVGYAIAPLNALKVTRDYADFVTDSKGGDRAVAEACLHIMEKFFNIRHTDFIHSN
jgi:3-deoxy-D-manno-octulosonate 8-phosphate phosphatase (KDO 8-P phosphatase)